MDYVVTHDFVTTIDKLHVLMLGQPRAWMLELTQEFILKHNLLFVCIDCVVVVVVVVVVTNPNTIIIIIIIIITIIIIIITPILTYEYIYKGKGKVIQLQARCGPAGG